MKHSCNYIVKLIIYIIFILSVFFITGKGGFENFFRDLRREAGEVADMTDSGATLTPGEPHWAADKERRDVRQGNYTTYFMPPRCLQHENIIVFYFHTAIR